MKILVVGLLIILIAGIFALYVGAKRYEASEKAKDSAAVAEARARFEVQRQEFLPPIPDEEEEILPVDEPEDEPKPKTLDEWLAINWRDELRDEIHDLREELDKIGVKLSRGLWALTETTIEWPSQWEDQLREMLAEKELAKV